MSDNLTTLDDVINDNRSPPLSPALVNYRFVETPPPLVGGDENSSTQRTSTSTVDIEHKTSQVAQLQPSLSDSLLIGLLGPDYPETASKASRQFILSASDIDLEDYKPNAAFGKKQMVSDYAKPVSHTSSGPQMMTVAAYAASQKLNAAISGTGLPFERISLYHHNYRGSERQILNNDRTNTQEKSPSPEDHIMGSTSPDYYAQKTLNVRPPPRISLPSIKTTTPGLDTIRQHHGDHSITASPILAKYSLTSINRGSDQQLPRMQTSPTLPLSSTSSTSKQTLPSLETALSAISASSEPTLSGPSPSLNRSSSAQVSYFGPSPSTYSTASPASAISPPRLPTAPSYWRTTSRETTNSTPSDHASVTPSNGVSTPASSVPGLSPSHSYSAPAHTPTANEHDLRNGDDSTILQGMTPRPGEDGQYSGMFGIGNFRCNFPGCNAQPFQTQYLLNSHANVHSNTRPHFCPVENCPRGPNGQGFKRKNEMIRHGLVHQSPGYVCPFCPDQQHKYPRPDNLQRHVRVHHVDRDRDDPLLREVLAQRPEGGNRGRRRRLGS